MPDEIHMPDLLTENLENISRSEARRLLGTGAVKCNGSPLFDLDIDRRLIEGKTIEVGRQKKSFVVHAGVSGCRHVNAYQDDFLREWHCDDCGATLSQAPVGGDAE